MNIFDRTYKLILEDLSKEFGHVFNRKAFKEIVAFIKGVGHSKRVSLAEVESMFAGKLPAIQHKKDLYVLKLSSLDQMIDTLVEDLGPMVLEDEDTEELDIEMQRVFDTTPAAYFKGYDDVGVMICNTNMAFDEVIVQHELVHYIQDLTGKAILSKSDLTALELTDDEDFSWRHNRREVYAYLNSFCAYLDKAGYDKKTALAEFRKIAEECKKHVNETDPQPCIEWLFSTDMFKRLGEIGVDISNGMMHWLLDCLTTCNHLERIESGLKMYFED